MRAGGVSLGVIAASESAGAGNVRRAVLGWVLWMTLFGLRAQYPGAMGSFKTEECNCAQSLRVHGTSDGSRVVVYNVSSCFGDQPQIAGMFTDPALMLWLEGQTLKSHRSDDAVPSESCALLVTPS